jgi:hypothetical protein
MLDPGARPIRPATAATGGSRTSSPQHIGPREIRGAYNGGNDKKEDQSVHEQRRNDPLPSFFLLLTRFESRVARDYFTSFGVVAITLTPAPRATSIAIITSEYFTVGSPFTKMILSGRGS